MSLIGDFIIQQTLIKGFRVLRENTNYVDALFRNLTSDELNVIRQFVKDQVIDITLSYPDANPVLPSINILLKSEVESKMFLGDLLQSAEDLEALGAQPFGVEELRGAQTQLGAGSIGTVWYEGAMLVEPTQAVGATSNEIWAPLSITNLIDPFNEESYVVVMEGVGAGQKRLVTSIIPDSITHSVVIEVSEDWDVVPDSTSIFKIIGKPDEQGITGEPARVFSSDDNIEKIGSFMHAFYQVDVNSTDQESTIFIYTLVKAIFFLMRDYLIKQGLVNFKFSGNDLSPLTEYFPQASFRRGLTVEFDYEFAVFDTMKQAVASKIIMTIEASLSEDEIASDQAQIFTELDVD